jgi:hypothetical protein
MRTIHTVALLSILGAANASADIGCRAQVAAAAGSQYGYEREKAAAIENERREAASSDVLGKCIGGITSVVVAPAFPSLGDIFNQAANRVCRVASDKLRQGATLPSPGVPGIPTTSIPVPIISQPSVLPRPATNEGFWNKIWR